MNERIKELADEAVTRVALRCEGSMESDKHGEWIRYDDLGKFAELIVQEVINIIQDQKSYNRWIYTTFDLDQAKGVVIDVVKSIKQRLG